MFDRNSFDAELMKLDEFAKAGYYLALHIRFTTPLMFFLTYPDDWTQQYEQKGYVLRDPMTAWSFATTGATRWSNPRIPDPFKIFDEARKFGLNYGVTVSAGPIVSRTVGSIARGDREFSDAEIAEIETITRNLHSMADPDVHLTRAQIEALKCVADGHRHTAAAAMLGISESAFKLRLSAAREKLMARTTAEAVQRAKDYKLL
ncbi:autoinducer binding domain-containing protein [Palleronia sp. LCG004]|uniref:autoinducer binding domain-containing protein n=1 Tax=Palleronia sp. LCG004 TaxID=3079304 RepID=UPI002941D4D6|nr:autoinducer binding domain-containing protein [Palleronia sp. LCG004]WOI56530.1 autoinducer binding domain-containing protein [Palleronia sp. LCG004]